MARSEKYNLTLCVSRPSLGGNVSALLVESAIPHTSDENHVLIRLDRFGFSANNVTYQALGEAPYFRYFDFHEAPATNETSPKSHGLIPVWGFGTVVWTSHQRIEVGERVYGYFAPTRYLLLPISPADVNKYSFFVSRPQFPRDRRPYNQVTRCRTDPQYDPSPEIEDLTMLYRPLFWTSFWCEDWLASSSFRGGASSFIISSASSKTAFCLAYLIRERFKKQGSLSALTIIGLTSKKNSHFTRSLRLYDVVVEYNSLSPLLEEISPEVGVRKWIYVDVAGNDELNGSLHSAFSSPNNASLVAHVSLGLTNLNPASPVTNSGSSSWTEKNTRLLDSVKDATCPASSRNAPGSLPLPENFFMPEWFAVRRNQLSVGEITTMQAEAWTALLRDGRSWIRLERVYGGAQVKATYEQAIRDGLGPERGYIWSMWEENDSGAVANAKL